MKKRIVSFILVACLAVLLLPTVAYAYSTGDDYDPTYWWNAELGLYVTEYNFVYRQCTDFVAWCLNTRNGVDGFDNHYNPYTDEYVRWGNAKSWGDVASAIGIPVNDTPAVGAVAWYTGGDYGHVAWVSSVNNDGTITIEEYNWIDCLESYGERTVYPSAFTGYIHIKDLGDTTTDIAPGVYTIHAAGDWNKVLNIAGNSTANRANIELNQFRDTDVQKFEIIKADDYYYIKSVHSGLWLDVSTLEETNYNVQLYNSNTLPDERWVFEYAGDGYVYIRNLLDGYYLDIAGNDPVNNANIKVYKYKESDAQKWKLVSARKPISIEPGVYTIHSARDNNKVLDIQGDSKESGANIQLYQSLGNTVQQFRIVEGNDYYNIQSVFSNMWLDVKSPAWLAGQNVQLYEYNTSNDEHWIFEDAGDGYVNIRNVYGNYLDLKNDSSDDRTNVQVWWRVEGNSQRWKLVPVTVNVSFDSNGGGGTMTTQSVTKESSFVLPNCTFTAPGGKQFKAWSIGGTEYAVGTSYTVTGNTTVTAIWEDIPSQVISISLNQPECNLAVGDSVTLVATVLPEDAKDRTVNWSSDTPSVATVDDDGRVTAVAPGTAKITATALGGENVTASCEVTVSPRVEYQIGTLTVRSTSGETLSTIPTGSFLVTIPVTKLTDSGDAVVVIASYTSDGQYRGLLYVGMKNATKGATVDLTLPVDNAEGDIAELKAFAINSFADRTPIGAASVFPSA